MVEVAKRIGAAFSSELFCNVNVLIARGIGKVRSDGATVRRAKVQYEGPVTKVGSTWVADPCTVVVHRSTLAGRHVAPH
jgi:hypothetical protein